MNGLNERKSDVNILWYALIPSVFISFLWLIIGRIISSDDNITVLSNIEIYICAILIFMVALVFLLWE